MNERVEKKWTGTPALGLEGVVVADTRLSEVDGARGRLIVAGRDVEDLADLPFEQVAQLLWRASIPGAGDRPLDFGAARVAAFARIDRLGDALTLPDGMDALRAALAQLGLSELPWPEQAASLTGAAAVFAAAWSRTQRGLAPVAPDPARPHAADYLRMVRGQTADPTQERAMARYLATVAEHGMNASTFAARVIASTGSDMASAVIGGVCALKGPLHGGAPGPVLDMLDAVGSPGRARLWLEAELAAGRRIMGMGHRIYRTRDPRAAVLERALGEVTSVDPGRLALARDVERDAETVLAARHPDRPLRANVEFYTAVLLESLGVPRNLFSPTFALARTAGWCAHYCEERTHGKLIRPQSHYTGPRP